MELPEPTGDQCTKRTILEFKGDRYLACWYPQMGGYSGKCLVRINLTIGGDVSSLEPGDWCFDAYVWHDGEFPFGAETGRADPAVVHHCSPNQFIEFGKLVKKVQAGEAP